jgi:hypothetical protein
MTAPVASLEAQISDLLSNFGSDSGLLNENNAYYEATYRPKAIGMAVPPPMKKLMAKIGWARTYVNAIEERLDIEGFRMVKKNGAGKADERLWQWWQANNMDVESGLAHTEALIHGRAYITVSAPVTDDPLSDSNTPVIKVESPRDIYAEVDPVTRRVKRAIRRYWGKNPVGAKIMRVTLYLPNSTIGLVEGRSGWEQEWRVDHNLGIVPVIPILNKERVRQEKGVTEIKPELRSKIDAASRLLMNLQATAELMAVPQRVLFGLDENEIAKIEGKSAWEAYLANILAFEDANGKIAQFAAAELRNFSEGMKVLREEASTITGLGPQYFHFGMDNPASAEAMQASEVRLVKKAERKCKIFGEAWETVMRVCMLVMDGGPLPSEAFRMETIWRNPATPTFAAKVDAASKALAATSTDGRSLVPVERLRVDLGYSPEEREEMEGWDEKAKRNTPAGRLADLYGQGQRPPTNNQRPSQGGAEQQ